MLRSAPGPALVSPCSGVVAQEGTASMAGKSARAVKPLTELRRLLPKLTNDELLEAALLVLENSADRAANYLDLLGDENVSADVLNEGLAFSLRTHHLFTDMFAPMSRPRERAAKQLVYKARRHLVDNFSLAAVDA